MRVCTILGNLQLLNACVWAQHVQVQTAKVVRLSLKTNFSRLGRVEALGRLVAYHNN
jgi:hypothetical protein